MNTIGTIDRIKRYPVKSLAGEDLKEGYVSYTGLVGDRVYAFVDREKATTQSNFPWHSAREQYNLLLYKPRFLKPLPLEASYPSPEDFAVEVTDPEGRSWNLQDPAFIEHLQQKSGCQFDLRFSEKGMPDARPLSIFSSSTLHQLTEEVGRDLDPRRFRANFYVSWNDQTPFFEDSLVGRQLRIGDKLEILISKKDPRCIMITLDPDTAESHPEVLRQVAKRHQGCAGVYAVVLREGIVRRGDAVHLI